MPNKVNGSNHYVRNYNSSSVRDTQKKALDRALKDHSRKFQETVVTGFQFRGPAGAAKAAVGYVIGRTIRHCVDTYKRDYNTYSKH